MNRAIPGESLTANPDEPKAWEQAPEFTKTRDALEYVLTNLIQEKVYLSIVGAIGKGIPISDVVQQILYKTPTCFATCYHFIMIYYIHNWKLQSSTQNAEWGGALLASCVRPTNSRAPHANRPRQTNLGTAFAPAAENRKSSDPKIRHQMQVNRMNGNPLTGILPN